MTPDAPPLRYESERYRRARHEGYVTSTFCLGARRPREAIDAHLRRPDTVCLVANVVGHPDDFMGWAMVTGHGEVVWAFTRGLARTRRKGVMTGLLIEAGVDPSKPTPCLFWSPDAAAIAARGYHFYFSPGGLKAAGLKEAA